MKKRPVVNKWKALKKKKPKQGPLFPQFDLKIVAGMIAKIHCHCDQIKLIERRANDEIIKERKAVRSLMRQILKLVQPEWQFFFGDKRSSARLSGALGWSKRRPKIVLTKKKGEIVKYLKSQYLSPFIQGTVDLNALKNNLTLARTIPGIEVRPQEDVIWLKLRGRRIRLGIKTLN